MAGIEIGENQPANTIPVLNAGFVRLVDHMGDDARIVQSARVSYGNGTKSVREDAALIDYLWRNNHTSPFENVIFQFHMKMPIFVARQMVRHRTARLNEVSGRYSVLKDEFYVPDPEQVRKQSTSNKQGRSDEELTAEMKRSILEGFQDEQASVYANYLSMVGEEVGLAKELARINLPVSTYTEWYWQMDLNNLLRFLALRLDAHAQYEIRVYAEAILALIEPIVPYSLLAFREHTLNSIKFSASELSLLKHFLNSRMDNQVLSECFKGTSEVGEAKTAAALLSKLHKIMEN